MQRYADTGLIRLLLDAARLGLDRREARNPTVRELLDATDESRLGMLERRPARGWGRGSARRSAVSYLSLDEFKPAEAQIRKAIELVRHLNGSDRRTVLFATNLLATVLERTNQAGEAEPMLRRNLAECRKVLGQDDPVALDAAEPRFGAVLWHVGRLDEAEAVLPQSVADRDRVLKPDHADTLRSVYLLGRLLREHPTVRRGQEAGLSLRLRHSVLAGIERPRHDRGIDQPGGRRA